MVSAVWVSLLLLGALAAVYWPVSRYQFVNLDDSLYVSANTNVLKGLTTQGVTWAFTTGHGGNWHPLTWVSHMLDAQLCGTGPTGPHVVNVAFHMANTLLLFLLLSRLTGAFWRSAIVAGLFAFHPLHVESVAWISERKDVLSAFFALLCLLAYERYVRQSKAHSSSAKVAYALALVTYGLGLMSKPMLVTLPFILLLLDYWPLKRSAECGVRSAESRFTFHVSPRSLLPLLLEKLPFFALCAASCVITFIVQKKGGAVQSLSQLSLGPRLENTPVAYVRYLGKTLWPVHLATPYPRPDHWPLAYVALAVAVLVVLTVVAVWLSRRARYVGVGWFWFVGMLVPVIGLVQVGEQSMADRYTYLPLIGLFVIVVWGAADACARWRLPRALAAVLSAVLLVACAVLSHAQLGIWQNSETLYKHDLAVTQKNWLAAYNLGWYYDSLDRLDEALTYYHMAIDLEPRYPDPLNNIGVALAAKKRYAEALDYFQRALKAEPGYYEAHNNIGKSLEELGRLDEAIPEYRLVLAKKPDHVGALNNLGNALVRKGEWAEAVQCYEASLRAKPDQATAHYGLGNALSRLGRPDDAIAHYREALRRYPDNVDARNSLGLALAGKGQINEALEQFRESLRLKPGDPATLLNVGRCLLAQEKQEEALPLLEQAAQLAPTNATVRIAMGQALAATGKMADATTQFREATRLQPRNTTAHFFLGRALAEQHNTEEAVREFNEVLRLRPDYAPAREAIQALTGQKTQ